MGSISDEIIERLQFEIELAGALIPADSATPEPSSVSAQPRLHEPVVSSVKTEKQQVSKKKVARQSKQAPDSGSPATPATSGTGRGDAVVENAAAEGGVAEDPYRRIENLIPEDSPLHTFSTLEEVSDYVANTVLIELDKVRLNPVFGVGNPDADLMVIGEAPGANEDEQGEPFVGRAGKLLTDILAAINFSRDDVFIANILKSRPPNNRNPTSDEIAAHVPILHKQIALIRPKIMLCVGKVAGNSLLGNTNSLSSMRGTFQDYHGLPVLVTFHPAALLRNPNWKRPTWEDVKLLRAKFDELVEAS